MARQFGVEKVDLQVALAVVAEREPLERGRLVVEFVDWFGCSVRAAQDAITVLRRGGFLACEPVAGDGRRRSYRLSRRGRDLLNDPDAYQLLRLARKLLTSCPSPRVRRYQRSFGGLAAREAELRRVESLGSRSAAQPQTRGARAASLALSLRGRGLGLDLESAIDLATAIVLADEQQTSHRRSART